jgi:uncharacterized protein (TIGR03437 family)
MSLLLISAVILALSILPLFRTSTVTGRAAPQTSGWSSARDLLVARSLHTATLLSSGKVLVAGGENASGPLQSAEIYDPATGNWTKTKGDPLTARTRHTATLLPSGKVLIAGGQNSNSTLDTAELYDPTTDSFVQAGKLFDARRELTATLFPAETPRFSDTLTPDTVLIFGGSTSNDDPIFSASLYTLNGGNGAWSKSSAVFPESRFSHTATLLGNGSVLLTGGFGQDSSRLKSCRLLTFADASSAVGRLTRQTLNISRSRHTATRLGNGRVLVIGGTYNSRQTEEYDPENDAWTLRKETLDHRAERHSATLLSGDRVLIVGGLGPGGTVWKSAEIYQAATDTWAGAGDLPDSRFGHTATLLANGKVLIAGGARDSQGRESALKSAALYTDSDPAVTLVGNLINVNGRKIKPVQFSFDPDIPPDPAATPNLLPVSLDRLDAGGNVVSTLTTTTNADGAYRFTGLVPGVTYQVNADRNSSNFAAINPESRKLPPLTEAITISDITIIFPTMNITGIIRDNGGRALPGIEIRITDPDTGLEDTGICGKGKRCTTGADGSYNLGLSVYSDYQITPLSAQYKIRAQAGTAMANNNGLFRRINRPYKDQDFTAGINSPPAVRIAAPNSGRVFTTRDRIDISVEASDSDGSVRTIELFEGSSSLTVCSSSPCNYAWTASRAGTYTMRAVATDDSGTQTSSSVVEVIVWNDVASVTATSYSSSGLAPESIVAAFGQELATGSASASAIPLPTTLAGTTVKVRDSGGAERPASLFYVSPTQINYQLPAGTATGVATVTITSGNGTSSRGTIQVSPVAPGLFSADSSGSGLAAAYLVRVRNGQQTNEAMARFDATQNKIVAVPIDLGPEGDLVVLVLYGTGIRNRTSLSAVTATIGGVSALVQYASVAGGFVGLDQVNVVIPRSLAGRNGDADVILTVDQKTANPVRINVR